MRRAEGYRLAARKENAPRNRHHLRPKESERRPWKSAEGYAQTHALHVQWAVTCYLGIIPDKQKQFTGMV
jgi:hypothetical protein